MTVKLLNPQCRTIKARKHQPTRKSGLFNWSFERFIRQLETPPNSRRAIAQGKMRMPGNGNTNTKRKEAT